MDVDQMLEVDGFEKDFADIPSKVTCAETGRRN